ncbi:hypothetical protein DAPPUDRAFT_306630 [Daphnia pulex]|uniref:Uncharacterized protein n=1 Tax=Daphnia pulex TaxID=6669 RepID=E9GXR8_DAPPU|nr:hypothetical protein DAPPUDRAFT_306630 [Daphnia pulex]|eukprot:EFX75709.1 hypothetical protein DAPPUDRAFT_306630 [Daphnia pulex]
MDRRINHTYWVKNKKANVALGCFLPQDESEKSQNVWKKTSFHYIKYFCIYIKFFSVLCLVLNNLDG